MSSNRYDRQNRVYGVEGTTKIQNSHVILFGERCDLLFEVAKNLALSGIRKLSFYNKCHANNFSTKSNRFFGNVHNFSYETIIQELSALNPYCEINMYSNQHCENAIFVFVNYDINKLIDLNTFLRFTVKTIAIYADAKNNFTIYNDFYSHVVTDIDGETYNLSTLVKAEKVNDECNEYIITTLENHNLYNDELICLEYTSNNIQYEVKTSVHRRMTTNTFSIKTTTDLTFEYGQVRHLKQSIHLNHIPISDIINKQIIIKSFVEINPVIQSFLGAVISSECIKAITNKYVPFDQSHTFNFHNDVVDVPNEELFSNLQFFIVGAGAIGCELLKNLAMLNCNNIHITDPDHIELSNLSRQFLFRNEHIGQSKSNSAALKIKEYNDHMNITPHVEKLSIDNQSFVDNIFPNMNIIFNALDNLQARLYVDSQVVLYKKPLFESGTLGVNGNVQPIIPFVTESYSASKDQQTDSSFAVCTIKHFPSLIQHTIHYALDDFNGLFVKWPQIAKTFLTNKEQIMNLDQNEIININNYLSQLFKILNSITSINNYIEWAYSIWYDNFYNKINKLLELYPEDKLNEKGVKFWSAGKRCPSLLIFNNHRDNINEYLHATCLLLLNTYQININNDYKLKDLIEAYDFNSVITSKYIINLEILNNSDKTIAGIDININPQEFEKDDDDNQHIKYIHYTSMFRAMNYNIPTCTFEETKGVAGKIIPALATTTSIVASLIVLEMLKYVIDNGRKLEDYNSYFVNLANNTFISSEPLAPKQLQIGNYKYTEWTASDFKYTTNDTLQTFITNMSEQFSCNIITIIAGVQIVYNKNNVDNLKLKLSELILKYETNEFVLDSVEDIEIPIITVCLV